MRCAHAHNVREGQDVISICGRLPGSFSICISLDNDLEMG